MTGTVNHMSDADPTEIAFFPVHAPVRTVLAEAMAAVSARWSVEECFETAKNECGLDQYEVRKWLAWYRHITLAMLAAALLAVIRANHPSPKGAVTRDKSV
ncbi:hypothetical protein GCM10009665_45090 [Kitasatospora nipponensis]|uniref:DDE family transposase n=1 Tax=Kitasatospora nipponensis TaxID=258049 RepID=A0ABN1WG07_9ACTN